MRSLLKRSVFLLLVFLNILTFTSCKKQGSETPSQVNLYQIIKEDKVVFTFLRAAIERAGMESVLANDKLTFIAPVNDAFIKAGYKTIKMVNEANPAVMESLIKNHILSIDVDALIDGAKLTTANNQQILVSKSEKNSAKLNGANITLNLKGINGKLAVSDNVLIPVNGNLMETIESDPNLLFFKTALLRASTGNIDFVQLLSGNAEYTVFALSNSAFTNTEYRTLALINAADVNKLGTFLSYYIKTDKTFTSQFTDRSTSLQMNKVPVCYDITSHTSNPLINGLRMAGGSNRLATNGIIHVLDGLLVAAEVDLNTAVIDLGYTYLAAAIARASTGSVDISALLSGTNEHTLIAPINAAFIAAGYASIDDIEATDPDVLAELLKLHILKDWKYSLSIYNSNDPLAIYNYESIAEKMVTFEFITPSYKVKGPRNSSYGNLGPFNYTCTNGVLHGSNIVLN